MSRKQKAKRGARSKGRVARLPARSNARVAKRKPTVCASSFDHTQLLAWKRLENQRALVDRWNGQMPQTVLGDKTNLLMPLPGEQK